MKHRYTLLIALSIILMALPALGQTYRVELGEERSGDPNGTGFAIINIDGTTISYVMSFHDIATPTSAHIHSGAMDMDGPILVDLMPSFGATSGSGSVTTTQANIDAITAAPGGHYLNVHTTEFPGGAIRGQLELAGAGQDSLVLELTNEAEVPGPGDPDASGHVTLDFRADAIDYTIQVENVTDPNAAHIHFGSALVAGPVFVNLAPMFENGIAIGSVPIDSATREQILSNLEEYYVNVHSPEFPGGAVRAQLAKEWVLPIVGKAIGANNTNFVTDVRIVNESMHPAEIRIDFFPSTLTGLEGPSMTRTFTLQPLNLAIADDIIGSLFSTDGLGAMTFSSAQELEITARVINDLRDQDLGTNGLFLEAHEVTEASTSGVLPFLSSTTPADLAAGIGFRTNVGFFNPTSVPVQLTMTVYHSEDGFVLGTNTVTVGPFQHLQQPIFNLASSVPEEERDHENFFATWSSDGPLFVYASVTDNRTGDAMVLD